ncbi:hypothetical protein [Chromobacterium haemolyticum]|uniref:hypothetical protein n=1 Tax=Chromobacterium haemolyticum TaxID=394935 RepID=UPI0013B3EA98|nr:hypothetical protein [Chromobacterium haemolyticum]
MSGINPIVKVLTGGKVPMIPLSLSIAFWGYLLIRIWTDTYAMALQGYGMVSEINKYIPFQAVISVASQFFLGARYGATGIVYGIILSFILTVGWIVPRKFYSITGN